MAVTQNYHGVGTLAVTLKALDRHGSDDHGDHFCLYVKTQNSFQI